MAQAQYDVLGIGNAIVDVIAHADDAFITENGLNKGAMTLIDTEQAEALYSKMGPGIESSGGSAANTLAGVASLGGRGAYIGKVCDDQLGQVFRHDIRAIGVEYAVDPATAGPTTARCLILVTPDAQRTMNTYLGVSVELGPDDVDLDKVRAAKVTYMEGYLFDKPAAKEAFRLAARTAHDAGHKVSFSLSDGFCVDRHRDDFLDLVDNHIDILFANEEEIKSLYQVDTFEEAAAKVRGHCEIACLTRSEKGSLILSGDERHEVPADKVEKVVDTTGAGDLYAAGFLFGYTRGLPLDQAARIGSVAAGEIVSHVGARPDVSLAKLATDRGLI